MPVKDTWLVIGGRGSGKTRLGAEWVNSFVRGYPPFADRSHGLIALVGETLGDVREVMIDGPSGIARISRHDRPRFEPSRKRLVWECGAVAHIFSSEDPESLRGPQFEAAWCDELGCPAIDKGPNQPNVFSDSKSAESATPHFSNGGRSDLAQRRFIDAHLSSWDSTGSGFVAALNPQSGIYAGRMLDPSRIFLWAWDTRPFPAFPLDRDAWADGDNWYVGHWLNGRLSAADLGDLIEAIATDFGHQGVRAARVDGFLTGYVLENPQSARLALEPLVELFGINATETDDGLIEFDNSGTGPADVRQITEMVSRDDMPHVEIERIAANETSGEIGLSHIDPMRDYQSALTYAGVADTGTRKQTLLSLPVLIEQGAAESLLAAYRQRQSLGRTRVIFGVPAGTAGIAPGSAVSLDRFPGKQFEVIDIEEGSYRRVTARRIERMPAVPDLRGLPAVPGDSPPAETAPLVYLLDLPLFTSENRPENQLKAAVWRKPWLSHTISVSPEDTGFTARSVADQPATIGHLELPLESGRSGRIDLNGKIRVAAHDGEFASVTRLQLLNGGNLCAIRANNDVWEVLQFERAEEIGAGIWQLDVLLRGQLGTENGALSGAAAGSPFVLLDDTIVSAGLTSAEIGLLLNFRIEAEYGLALPSSAAHLAAAGGLRALLPYAPVHLRAEKQADGTLVFDWIRRSRTGADTWLPAEIPLGEETEAYIVDVVSDGQSVRTANTTVAQWVYSAAEQLADFGSAETTIDVQVRQMSAAIGPGQAASHTVTI